MVELIKQKLQKDRTDFQREKDLFYREVDNLTAGQTNDLDEGE